jgi:glycosyltransferase involved in cell wall biosynthesis
MQDMGGSSVVAGLTSVVVPVYNERPTIAEVLRRLAAVPFRKEVIVVDDGSTDGTSELLRLLPLGADVKVVFAAENRGKGRAFRLGLASASGEAIVIQDADLEYDPSDIPSVVEPILTGRADVCYGSRIRGVSRGRSSQAFYWGGRLLSFLTTALYWVHVTDEATGYKAFRTQALRSIALEGEGFELEPEMTAKVLRLGLRYVEVPVSYVPRRIDQGKKISWRDGLRAMLVLFVWRFRPMPRSHPATPTR